MDWKDVNTGYICPICGLNLGFIPWDEGSDSQEICPCCGNQFGYTDASPTPEGVIKRWKERRTEWIANDMKWWHSDSQFEENNSPSEWNPREQLKNIPKEFLGPGEKY